MGLINGQERTLPIIGIAWDAETQNVQLCFDQKVFKTWDFVLALIEMGKMKAQEALGLARVQNMQAMQQQAMQQQAVLEQLRRPRP